MAKYLYLLGGGMVGTALRYFFSVQAHRWGGTAFPYGTLAANITGCFVIGFLAAWPADEFPLGMNMKLFLVTGFCGALTTFSALILETANLFQEGDFAKAAFNLGVNLTAGFAVFMLGALAARFF